MAAIKKSGTQGVSSWLWFGLMLSILIAGGAVLRRLAALANPSQSVPAQMAALDEAFASHTALTLAHIVPALAFVLMVPIVLLRHPPVVWAKRLFFAAGAIVGITAYAMSVFAVGGWLERTAVLVFDSLFLYSLARAYLYGRSGARVNELRCLLRGIWVLLGIATTRPVMGVFFATAQATHLGPAEFFGFAFWIGFSLNTIAVELWLRSEGFQRYVKAVGANR